jgi:septal ring factor EnvC (AmiA/AmiB activator)
MKRRSPSSVVLAVVAVTTVLSAQNSERLRTEAQAERVSDRLQALQREATELANQERTLLVDLRRLEVERDLRTEQLRQLDRDTARVVRDLDNTANQIDALEQQEAEALPTIEARMNELYKLGSAGYTRLLFDVSDLKEFGRAYRMVTALAAVDRQRAIDHQKTIAQLRAAQSVLAKRRKELTKLRQAAQAARVAADRAATERSELIAEIDRRRDLTAELAAELQGAQLKLRDTLSAVNTGAPQPIPEGSLLPLRPFRGDLDWPCVGRVMSRFGRPGATVSTASAQNGIQISVAEGTPVQAIHDGTVAFVGPFTGYGNLVIIDHGAQSYSLYGQLGTIQVERGTRVDRGQIVGLAGHVLAGFPGMYFEMRVDGKPVDPLEWLKKKP